MGLFYTILEKRYQWEYARDGFFNAENETNRFQRKLDDRNRTVEWNGYTRGGTVSRYYVRGIWVMEWWVGEGRVEGYSRGTRSDV